MEYKQRTNSWIWDSAIQGLRLLDIIINTVFLIILIIALILFITGNKSNAIDNNYDPKDINANFAGCFLSISLDFIG